MIKFRVWLNGTIKKMGKTVDTLLIIEAGYYRYNFEKINFNKTKFFDENCNVVHHLEKFYV